MGRRAAGGNYTVFLTRSSFRLTKHPKNRRSHSLRSALRSSTRAVASMCHSPRRTQVLYLTTVGRRTGLPREIEIWFVVWRERLYLFAETREAAGWVKNIRRTPKVE